MYTTIVHTFPSLLASFFNYITMKRETEHAFQMNDKSVAFNKTAMHIFKKKHVGKWKWEIFIAR